MLKKLTGGGEFCSDAHRNKYQEEYNKLALSRLLQAQAPNTSASGNLSPRALRQLPPPAPRAGAPRALPPPGAPPVAETKKGAFGGLFSSRKPAAIEAPAASAPAAAAPPVLPAPTASESAAPPPPKSSIWKTFVRTERPAPPPPPEPDPVEASFLLTRVEVRKPLGKTLMAPIVIDPVFPEDVSSPAGASAAVSLVEPVPFAWDEAFLQYCCDSEVEVGPEEVDAVSAAVEVESAGTEAEAIAPSDEVDVVVAAGDEEVEGPATVEAMAESLVEPPSEESPAEAEAVAAEPPAPEDEPTFVEPLLAAPIVSGPVCAAPPPPFAVLGTEPELAFTGLVLYPTSAEVDLGSLRPTPVREKFLEPVSFGASPLPAAQPRSFTPRISNRAPQFSKEWHFGEPWQSWRPSLQFVPPPQSVRPAESVSRVNTPAPPPPASVREQHHEVVINLAALGVLEDE